MRKHFIKMQDATKNDVEKAFGIFQACWRIIKNLIRKWNLDTINDIMLVCIIIHNMIIEEKYKHNLEGYFDCPMQMDSMQLRLICTKS